MTAVPLARQVDNFRWTSHDKASASAGQRYPHSLRLLAPKSREIWAEGMAELAVGLERGSAPDSTFLARWVERIGNAPADESRLDCPRVFVSHRRADEVLARRIAWISAVQCGVHFWLDVIDLPQSMTPLASRIHRQIADPRQRQWVIGYLQAAIIEMALVNCTHVLAVVTAQTRGSWWVPYEYGKIAQGQHRGARLPAAAWRHPTQVPVQDLPEYLWLRPIHASGAEIRTWLQAERARWPHCKGSASWRGKVPPLLPGE